MVWLLAEQELPAYPEGLTAMLRIVCVLMLMLIAPQAFAEKRVALVIGNSAYQFAPELRNPKNDANALAASLEALSFEVIRGIDLDNAGMQLAVAGFSERLQTADVALLFYAGHGLQVEGVNYLLPVNGQMRNKIDLQFQGIRLDFLLSIMESPGRTSIVLLDACRDNPLAESLARSLGTRSGSVGRGLARVETGVGTYIGYSTQPGNIALDGDGDNSPFATALLQNLDKDGLDIEAMMRLVRADVMESTRNQQIPWGNSSLVGKGFVFKDTKAKPGLASPASAPDKPDTTVEVAYWNSIKDATDKGFFEAYLQQYPKGTFAALAYLRINQIDKRAADEKQAVEAQQAEQKRLEKEAAAKAVEEDAAREKARLAQAGDAEKIGAELKAAEAERNAAEDARIAAEKRFAEYEASQKLRVAEEAKKSEAIAEAEKLNIEDARSTIEELRKNTSLENIDMEKIVIPVFQKDKIMTMQKILYDLNYDVGYIDGLIGEYTKKAIIEYELRAGLKSTGVPTERLYSQLIGLAMPRSWGAIIFSEKTGKWGMSVGAKTRKDAVVTAAKACAGENCLSELSFFGGECAALASSDLGWAISTGRDRRKAEISSIDDCKTKGSKCKILVSGCADDSPTLKEFQ